MNKFSNITKRILERLPYWFKMRHDQDSLGAQFLNCFGLEFEDINYVLNYAISQTYLQTADINQADICYKFALPSSVTQEMNIELTSGDLILRQTKSLKEFFLGFNRNQVDTPATLMQDPFYIDYQKRLVYVKYPYKQNDEFPDGQINLKIKLNNNLITQKIIGLSLHHVWNFFDEFGLLLNTPRLYSENNKSYKKRLVSVFRFPAGAHRQGIVNAIARELMLTKQVEWPDMTKDLPLYEPNIVLATLAINGEVIPESEYTVDNNNRVILLGRPFNNKSCYIDYSYGVRLHTLFDQDFQEELFTPDGDATDKLNHYIKTVNDLVNISWGKFIWGQEGWDPMDNNIACVPYFYDASVSGWENYKEVD